MASIDDYLKAKVNQFTSSFSKRPLVGGLVGQGVNYIQQQAPRIAQQVQQVSRQAPQSLYNANIRPTIQGFNAIKSVAVPTAQAYGNIIKDAGISYAKTTPAGQFIANNQNLLAKSSPNPIGNAYLKAVAPFRNPVTVEDVGNIASGVWGAPKVASNIIGGGIGYGINKFTKQDTDAEAYRKGIEFSSKVGGIGKLLETPLASLVKTLNPTAAQKIGDLMDKGLTKQAFSQLWKNVRTAAITGGIEGGAYGAALPAKDAKQWVKNIFDNATQFAAFSGGTAGVKDLSTIGFKGSVKGLKALQNKVNTQLKKGMTGAQLQEANVVMAPIDILVSHEGAPDRARVEYYKKLIQNGKKVDPIVIVNEGAKYGIDDGKHRFQAYKELGYNQVPAIFKGGEEYRQMMARADLNAKLPKQLPKEEITVFRGGRDMGDSRILTPAKQNSGALFFTESEKYAKQYSKTPDQISGLYKTNIKTDKIFDITNPQHIKQLEKYIQPEALQLMKDTTSHGAVDWATASQYTDEIEKAGFKGAKFLERPAENITQLPDGSFKLEGKPVYSYALFDKQVPMTRVSSVKSNIPKSILEKEKQLEELGRDLTDMEQYGDPNTFGNYQHYSDQWNRLKKEIDDFYNQSKGLQSADLSTKLPKSLPKELEGNYLYHGTNETALENIAKEGLKPGRTSGKISLSPNESYSQNWARGGINPQGKTEGVMLRVNQDLLKTKILPSKSGVQSDQINELISKDIIPPDALEIYKNGKWIPLNQAKGLQSADLSFTIPETKPVKKLVAKNNKQVAEQVTLPVSKPRGFTESVKEAPNVKPNVKQGVTASYKVKPNSKLMGEAEALLHEGAKLNFTNVKDADRKVAATIQEAINQQRKNPQAAANLFNNLSEQGTELGRGVQAFSLLKKMTPESIALSAAGKIKRYNMTATRKIPELTGEQVRLIAKRVDALNRLKVGSREHNIAVNELYKTINEFIPSSIGDKAITVWKAGLLTSLRTHERNLIGNTLHQGAEIVKDIPANLADRLMSARTGQRTTTLTVKGLKEGGRKGMQAAKDIISSGYDPEQAISKYDVRHVTWGNNPVEQGLKKYTDIVFRTLGAADKPFWNAAYARSLYDQAGAQAINAGKGGNAKYIESLVKKPTEEMLLTAAREANVATFHDKNVLSSVVNAAKQQLSKNEYTKVAGEVLAPFTGVPSSIAGQMVAYSPVGLIKGALKVGKVLTQNIPELQRQAAQEVGRGVVGAGLWGLGAYLVSKGLMTGQPKDQKEADQWQIEGKQANSVLIGGKWRSINSIGPEFLILLAGAKFQQEMNKGEDANVGSYLAGVGKDFMSQTFLQGVQGPLNALNDPQRFGKSYVGGQISSVIPNIIKDTAKALDPFQRETNSVSDYVKNSIPGVRNQGVPKRDVLGNELPQEPTGINAYIDLFNSKTPIKNNVIDELSRLNTAGFNAVPSKLNKTQTIQGEKTVLTPEQLDSLEKFRGPVLSKALEQLFQSSSYQAKSDQDKADAVDTVVKRVNKYIRGEGGAPTFNSGETSKPLDTQEVIKPKTIKTKTSKTPKAKTLKASKARKPKKVKALKLKKVPMAKFKKFKTPKLASKQIKYAKLKKPKTYRLDLKSLAVKV